MPPGQLVRIPRLLKRMACCLFPARYRVNPENGKIPEGIIAQTEQVMKNIEAILTEAGYTFADVIKSTCLLSDMANFKA